MVAFPAHHGRERKSLQLEKSWKREKKYMVEDGGRDDDDGRSRQINGGSEKEVVKRGEEGVQKS
jgi:hypothetical protein